MIERRTQNAERRTQIWIANDHELAKRIRQFFPVIDTGFNKSQFAL
jgi:hypothetical protein